MGTARLRRERSRPLRPAVLAGLLRAHPLRRGDAQRRRRGRVLSDPRPLPSRERLDEGGDGPVRRAGRRVPAAGARGACARRPACRVRRRARRPSGMDRGGRQGAAAPALGQSRDVGDVRAGPAQLRAHDRDRARDRRPIRRAGDLRQPLGRQRAVLLRDLPAQLQGGHGQGPARHEPRRPRAAGLRPLAAAAAPRALGRVGRGHPRGAPRCALHSERPARPRQRRPRRLPGRRSPGAARADATLGLRALGQAVPRRDGPKAAGGPLQRRGRGAVPVEGLGAGGPGGPPLGPRRHRQRSSRVCSTTGAGSPPSRTCTPGITATSATSATRRRWPTWRSSTRSRRATSTARTPRSHEWTTTSRACTTRWSRRASPSRW